MIDEKKLSEAVEFAAVAHRDQVRKSNTTGGVKVPYLGHLLGVTSIVVDDGGGTDEAIAALLHDTLEDQPERVGTDDIRTKFGDRVLHLVQACTGLTKEQEPDFRTRKQRYLDHLGNEADAGAVRVSLADKVHNARSTVNDLDADGASVWDRFNAPYIDQIWWYTGLSDTYIKHAEAGRANVARVAELRRLVDRMRDFDPEVTP